MVRVKRDETKASQTGGNKTEKGIQRDKGFVRLKVDVFGKLRFWQSARIIIGKKRIVLPVVRNEVTKRKSNKFLTEAR